jgi:hypothetical protein
MIQSSFVDISSSEDSGYDGDFEGKVRVKKMSLKRTICHALTYDRKFLKMKICFQFIKEAGFDSLYFKGKKYLNWKNLLVVVAVLIALTALYYANNLTKKLAHEERKKVEIVQQAFEIVAKENSGDLTLAFTLINSNETIPLINTDSKDTIININNIDTVSTKDGEKNSNLLKEKLAELKAMHPPITIKISDTEKQYVYYGESELLRQLRMFPYILLIILFLFLIIVVSFITSNNRQIQDRVWVGMSKETAHQLGTPLTSLVAWIEYLKETETETNIQTEQCLTTPSN